MQHFVAPLWDEAQVFLENIPAQIWIKGTKNKGNFLHCEHYLNKISF